MTTKMRFRNKYRLQLREKDHGPMHVHLVGGAVNARIDLVTLEVVAGFIPAGLHAEVHAWLVAHKQELMKEWKQWPR
jgi:Domain of unknown function (DUF4160)